MARARNHEAAVERDAWRGRSGSSALQKLAVALTVALLITLAPSSSVAMDDDMQPGDAPIQPGAPVCTPSVPWDPHPCGTLGFVLRDRSDNLYITTAAHGYHADPNSDRRAYTADNGPFPYGRSNGFGAVVIDDDTETDVGGIGTGSDVALIAIDPDKYDFVKASVRHWTGPTAVLLPGESRTGDVVYNYTLKNDPPAQAGRLIDHNSDNFNTTLQAREVAGGGASGSPYIDAKSGRALGLNANCLCGTGVFGYATLDYVLRRFSEVHGKDLRLLAGRYNPPAPEAVL